MWRTYDGHVLGVDECVEGSVCDDLAAVGAAVDEGDAEQAQAAPRRRGRDVEPRQRERPARRPLGGDVPEGQEEKKGRWNYRYARKDSQKYGTRIRNRLSIVKNQLFSRFFGQKMVILNRFGIVGNRNRLSPTEMVKILVKTWLITGETV